MCSTTGKTSLLMHLGLLFAFLGPVVGQSSVTEFGIQVNRVDRQVIRDIAPFSSLVHFNTQRHRQQLGDLLPYARSFGLKAVLDLGDLLFTPHGGGAPPPPRALLPNAAEIWKGFVEEHREVLGAGTVWAFYLVDEPFWNGIPVADLQAAQELVKASFPDLPTMTSLNRFDIAMAPEDLPADLLDRVGYHMYGVSGTLAQNEDYQTHLRLLQEKLPGRGLVIVADAWWRPSLHAAAGLTLETMGERMEEYRQVAEQAGAVALGAFVWDPPVNPGAPWVGLGDFPAPTQRRYMDIASRVAGRCGLPAQFDPEDSGTVLFLQGCRFAVRVRFVDPRDGLSRWAGPAPLTSDTGTFFFFREANVELTLKVLDGRSFNDHWWVFWSELTSLDLTVEVLDTATGRSRIYHEAVEDTAAFPGV